MSAREELENWVREEITLEVPERFTRLLDALVAEAKREAGREAVAVVKSRYDSLSRQFATEGTGLTASGEAHKCMQALLSHFGLRGEDA